jgi:hypothetical protein
LPSGWGGGVEGGGRGEAWPGAQPSWSGFLCLALEASSGPTIAKSSHSIPQASTRSPCAMPAYVHEGTDSRASGWSPESTPWSRRPCQPCPSLGSCFLICEVDRPLPNPTSYPFSCLAVHDPSSVSQTLSWETQPVKGTNAKKEHWAGLLWTVLPGPWS